MHDSTDICKVVLTLIKHGMVTLAKLLIGNQSMSFSKRCKDMHRNELEITDSKM